MKARILGLVGVFAALSFTTACNQSSEQEQKIQALEEKIAQLEAKGSSITPVNAQTTQAADPSTLGAFQFEEMEYNFGTINEGEVVERVFNFTNNGEAPLVISNITASCGCTSPDWTKTPVNPGETGFVKVVFNSTAKSGAQAPTVTIQANTNPTVTRLRLRGNVTPKTGGPAPVGPVKR
ncbi:DUF1573 domain-containing protein [Algoriphagus kandeliae]|uniref:DUF1573 domain-containing protein n=1 Tax=Algoriphagus kandeliae TaxID=2562278 RepID=A0A4Y9QTX9_9BACT|nr:DUF1573 domain-containing protein [Algoriphagus kandeliae]TFV96054.1 DUF1573 domain-containing protein [Algoriphagus kandeliae]